MATEDQVLNKVGELLSNAEDFILQRVNSLMNSGAVDISGGTDNYAIPKALLYAAMQDALSESTLASADKKIINNLKYF